MRAETGDTLSDIAAPAVMEPWTMPEPLLPTAVTAKSSTDEDKLAQGLSRLVAEDPTVRVEMNSGTHQMVLWSMGEAHLEVMLDKLRKRHSIDVETEAVKVSLRETLAKKAAGHGRHVKQSGGHGQYAVCDIEGAGFEFVDKVVGGSVPRQFIPSVEKGVRAQMEKGIGAGYPVVDLRVTLVGGKAHSVDSSDAAFQMAGSLALKEAATAGGVGRLLVTPGTRHRDDGRGQRPHRGRGRGTGDRTDPLRRRPAVPRQRDGCVHPQLRPARPDAAAPGGEDPGGDKTVVIMQFVARPRTGAGSQRKPRIA